MPQTRAGSQRAKHLATAESNTDKLGLPQHLLEAVVGFLDAPDISRCRLACSCLEAAASSSIDRLSLPLPTKSTALAGMARQLNHSTQRLGRITKLRLARQQQQQQQPTAGATLPLATKLPASFQAPFQRLSATLTLLSVDVDVVLPKQVALQALRAASLNLNVTQGVCQEQQLSWLSDLAAFAPHLQHLYCKSLKIDAPPPPPPPPQQQQQPGHQAPKQQQQQKRTTRRSAAAAAAAADASTGAALPAAPAPAAAEPAAAAAPLVSVSLPTVTHFGCGAVFLPAPSVDAAAARFAATFPALTVLFEAPYAISSLGDDDGDDGAGQQEPGQETAVPLGTLLAGLPRLRALRANSFECLARLRSLASLSALSRLEQLSLHVSVPSFFDIFHFSLVFPTCDEVSEVFASVAALQRLQRLQLTFELNGADSDVADLLRRLAALPDLASLALPQQLLCPGCYPDTGPQIAAHVVEQMTRLTRLVLLNVDQDRHDDRITTAHLRRSVAARNQQAAAAAAAAAAAGAPHQHQQAAHQQAQAQPLVFELEADQQRWWSCVHTSRGGGGWGGGCSCGPGRTAAAASGGAGAGDGGWGVLGPAMEW